MTPSIVTNIPDAHFDLGKAAIQPSMRRCDHWANFLSRDAEVFFLIQFGLGGKMDLRLDKEDLMEGH